jgi:hypothetical protein
LIIIKSVVFKNIQDYAFKHEDLVDILSFQYFNMDQCMNLN